MQSSFHSLRTADGVHLELHSLQPMENKAAPVLLVHGIGATLHMWHSPRQGPSLAQYLVALGHPVFSLSLRHRHESIDTQWDLDHYVEHDIPTALQFIQELCARPRIHYIGHSMGGILALMYQILQGAEDFLSVTTLGSPGLKAKTDEARFIHYARPLIGIAGLVTCHARLHALPGSLVSSLLLLESIAAHPTELKSKLNQWRDPEILRYCGNISRAEVDQLTSLLDPEGMHSPRLGVAYGNLAHRVTAPHLAIASNRDLIAPPILVKQGIREIASPKKFFYNISRSKVYRSSYSHHDLVMSSRAQHDIWPLISRWIADNDDQSEDSCTLSLGLRSFPGFAELREAQ